MLPGQTIFDVWETEGALGSKMTPATASAGYREFICALIAEQAPEEARILSVGFGNGKVETTLRALGYQVFGVELFWRALQGGQARGYRLFGTRDTSYLSRRRSLTLSYWMDRSVTCYHSARPFKR